MQKGKDKGTKSYKNNLTKFIQNYSPQLNIRLQCCISSIQYTLIIIALKIRNVFRFSKLSHWKNVTYCFLLLNATINFCKCYKL